MAVVDFRSLDVSYLSTKYDSTKVNIILLDLINDWLGYKRVEGNRKMIGQDMKDCEPNVTALITNYIQENKIDKNCIINTFNAACAHFTSDTWNLINPTKYNKIFLSKINSDIDEDQLRLLKKTIYVGRSIYVSELEINTAEFKKAFKRAFKSLGKVKKIIHDDRKHINVIIKVKPKLASMLSNIRYKSMFEETSEVIYNPSRQFFCNYSIFTLSDKFEYYPYLVIRIDDYISKMKIENMRRLKIDVPEYNTKSIKEWILKLCKHLSNTIAINGLCYEHMSGDTYPELLDKSDNYGKIVKYYKDKK